MGSLIVPPSVSAEVRKIAGFKPEDDGLGDYPLDKAQTKRVAKILGFKPETGRFYYYVEPYDPPEDSGFREQTPVAR